MRWPAIGLLFFALACYTTTSHTRTGTGFFAPRENAAEEEDDAPRGLSLSVGSIATDGTVTLELRNYSEEPFVFAGTPDKPRVIIEARSGDSQSRHTVSPLGTKTHEVPAGERIQLKTSLGGVTGQVRIGIRSKDFGYTVWTDWMIL